MADSQITVVIVSWYSSDWLRLLFQNLRTKAACPERLQFLVVDNTGGRDEELRELINEQPSVLRVVDHDASGLQRSVSHASGLNRAIDEVDTEYMLICDPDVHVFLQDWDATFLNELSNERVAVGAPYPPWKIGKYHDFPSPIFCFLQTCDARSLGGDWSPFPDGKLTRLRCYVTRQCVRLGGLMTRENLDTNRFLRTIAGPLERIGGISEPDTGYRLCKSARSQKRLSTCLRPIFTDDSAVKDRPAVWRETARHYELYFYKNKPALAHKYNSHVWLWQTPRGADSQYFLNCVEGCEATEEASANK